MTLLHKLEGAGGVEKIYYEEIFNILKGQAMVNGRQTSSMESSLRKKDCDYEKDKKTVNHVC